MYITEKIDHYLDEAKGQEIELTMLSKGVKRLDKQWSKGNMKVITAWLGFVTMAICNILLMIAMLNTGSARQTIRHNLSIISYSLVAKEIEQIKEIY